MEVIGFAVGVVSLWVSWLAWRAAEAAVRKSTATLNNLGTALENLQTQVQAIGDPHASPTTFTLTRDNEGNVVGLGVLMLGKGIAPVSVQNPVCGEFGTKPDA